MANRAAKLLTPKQVAQAIGVSESSLKRWCDQGKIPMICTAGGHRRLPLEGVLEFIRTSKRSLVDPEAIYLESRVARAPRSVPAARKAFEAALIAGDEGSARQTVLDMFLAGQRLSVIGDEVIAPSFQAIGELWECGELEVFRERLACRMCSRILAELRGLMPIPKAAAPTALGGTYAGDFYELATTLAELVLRENGWQATSLGSSLPRDTLIAAIGEHRPRLFWLSMSYIADEEQFLSDYAGLYEAAAGKTALVVGGRALSDSVRRRMKYAAFCDNLQHLETFIAAFDVGEASLPSPEVPSSHQKDS